MTLEELQSDKQLKINLGDVVEMDNSIWTVRSKTFHAQSKQEVYFMTCPGFEGWFTIAAILAKQEDKP